jgi:hypothetical protein
MALVGYRNAANTTDFKCGGSIISKRHVLTGLFTLFCHLYFKTYFVIVHSKLHIADEAICKFIF